MVKILKVEHDNELKKFIDFPHTLYENDPNYVPELYISQKAMFNKNKYPFFEHSKAAFLLAYKGDKVVGRIVVIRNNNHINFTGEKCGFFGFFESIEDYQVAKALIEKAINWLKEEGLSSIVGPENYTTNDSCGFLTKGFDQPPAFMMPYNKAYYIDFFERLGFEKKIDLASYFISSNKTPTKIAPYIERVEERLKSNGVIVRTINLKNFKKEIEKFREVYNSAYENNWGFVPLTDTEFTYQATELKKIADSNLILFAEKNDNLIGFVCAIPDINQILINVKNGRLFPFGFLKLLFNQKKITNSRILIIGVVPKYRHLGIDAVLFSKLFHYGRKKNIQTAEAAYVMEDNIMMNKIIQKLGGTVTKKYRIFELTI